MRARRLASVAHVTAVVLIGALTVWATATVPFSSPAVGQAVCIVTGSAAAALAGMWLPCPCHRRDRAGRGASEIKHPSMARTRAHFAASPLPRQQDRRAS